MKKLFTETYPLNSDLDEVLIKVSSLNDFYSTNIISPFKVAKSVLAYLIVLELLLRNYFNLVEYYSKRFFNVTK